jgi:hypothetical protein
MRIVPYFCQELICIVKVLQKHCDLTIIRRPLHQLAELPVHGLHVCKGARYFGAGVIE